MKEFFEKQTRSDKLVGLCILAVAMAALFAGWSI